MELPQRVALMAHVTVLTDRPATARLNGYQKPTDHGRRMGGCHGPRAVRFTHIESTSATTVADSYRLA